MPKHSAKQIDFLFRSKRMADSFIKDILFYNSIVPEEEKFLKINYGPPKHTIKGNWKVTTFNFKNKDCHPQFKVPESGLIRVKGTDTGSEQSIRIVTKREWAALRQKYYSRGILLYGEDQGRIVSYVDDKMKTFQIKDGK